MLCMQRSIERTRRKLRSRTPARASAWRPGQQRGTSAITGSCSRKENTQCVLYSDPGQRVLYAFFTFFFYLPNVRVFYSDPPPRFLPRF